MPIFTMEPQQEDYWCWAAVAVSIHNFLDPLTPLTQGALATRVLQGTAPPTIGPAVNCTLTPGACDSTASLSDALGGNLDEPFPGQPATFQSISNEIDAGRPVCVQIDWQEGGAHAIALDGYYILTSGAEVVSVQDPWPGYGPSLQLYSVLLNDYQANGIWASTFTVKP
jgi:hypothetical protein